MISYISGLCFRNLVRVKMWSTPANAVQNGQSKTPQTLGMTSAISTAAPKPADLVKTKELEESLKPFDVFESEQELNHRMVILGKLFSLVKEWIKDVSIKRNMPETIAGNVGGKICTFGSYRLGVHNKGADIDALCVAPRHISRSDYFTSFMEVLKQQPEVTDLRVSFWTFLFKYYTCEIVYGDCIKMFGKFI